MLQKCKPFETDMCEGQSNLKKTMRLKDDPFQNATEAAKANRGGSETELKVKGV